MARAGVKTKIVLSAGLALVLLAGCERSSAVASKDHAGGGDRGSTYEDRSAPSSDDRRASDDRGGSRRADEQVRLVDGKPIWSSSRRGSAEENAQKSFDRNGEAFGARNLDDFVRKAHAFVERPPAGTERLTRRNGDVLLYDPKGNVFAVANKDGTPRAMFKPDQGSAYWDQQKTREARSQTARSDRKDRGNGDSDS
jgi:pyocin large subunit-like protein